MKRFYQQGILTVWAMCMLAIITIIAHTHFTADLSAFLPKTPNIRQQMLINQLRDGAISRIVLLGIEGGDAQTRTRLSHQLRAKLAHNPQFNSVQNGETAITQRDQRYYFDNRYLLSPTVTAERFSITGMHQAIQALLYDLSGNAGLLIKQILPRDPTGETLQVLDQFSGDTPPRTDNGVWVSRDGQRAVLMAQLAHSGLDTDAQERALHSLRTDFDTLPSRPADVRLLMSGTSVLSVSARDTIKSEVTRLATIGIALVICLLLMLYRSPRLLVLGLIPVVCGALAGIAAVSLGFGHVHGLTLGFGTTLIGEAVDYSIYLFIQREGKTYPTGFWRTIWLGVLTSIIGFATLLSSNFPGLSQLGLYSMSGLVTAMLVTRYVLPILMPAETPVRDLHQIGLWLQQIFDRLTHLRWLVITASVLAAILIVVNHNNLWNRSPNALSPLSSQQSKLDTQLRNDLSSNNMRYVVSFIAPNQESALVLSERIDTVLQRLVRTQILGGFHSPNQLLPSLSTQRARQAALPDEHTARQNLQTALAGLPLLSDKLEGFLTDLRTARKSAPLTRHALDNTVSGMLLESMLIKRSTDYLVMIPLIASGQSGDDIDLTPIRTALTEANLGQATVIDLLEETTGIFSSYTHQALVLSSLSCLAILLLLAITYGPRRMIQIALPLACAVVSVIALLYAFGIQLTILHWVGLLLVVAIGSNYALFFVRGTGGNTRKTETSLVIANLATVISFGLLGTSSVPALSYIGSTVAIGVLLALIFSAILVRARAHAPPP